MIARLTLVLLAVLCLAQPALSQEPLRQELPLYQLAPVGKLTLHDAFDSYRFYVPVPERHEIRAMWLKFSFTNSSALLPENSRLVLSVAGQPVGQVGLAPRSPDGKVEIAIPGNLLKPGYVPFVFTVAQHYTKDCETFDAPELWTVLNLDQATVAVEYQPRPAPTKLSAVNGWCFDPKNFLDSGLHVALPELSEFWLTQAAKATSAAAARFDFRPMPISCSTELRPGMDNLVIGTADFVKAQLSEKGPRISQSLLWVGPNPAPAAKTKGAVSANPQSVVLVMSGSTPEATALAVDAFALSQGPLPAEPSMAIDEVAPAIDIPVKNSLEPGREYTFRNLSMRTVSFQEAKAQDSTLTLHLPSDTYLSPSAYVLLSLHLAYGAGMKPDSSLSIFLNNDFIASVPMDNPQGNAFLGYKISFPASILRRGKNDLVFKTNMASTRGDRCAPPQRPSPLTLFDDSTLGLPKLPRWIEMPRLDAVFNDGFPFSQSPDLAGVSLFLPRVSPGSASAALSLVGLLAQKTGQPPLGLTIKLSEPTKDASRALVVGEADTLPGPLAEALPLRPTSKTRLPEPQAGRPKGVTTKGDNWWEWAKQTIAPVEDVNGQIPPEAFINLAGPAMTGRALLAQVQTPGVREGSTLVLTAQTSDDLRSAALAVLEPGFQSRISGDLALINLQTPDKSEFLNVGAKYYLGDAGAFSPATRFFNARPWLALSLALGSLAVLTIATTWLLRRFMRRRRNK